MNIYYRRGQPGGLEDADGTRYRNETLLAATREPKLWDLVQGSDLTYAEIGQHFGITQSRVCMQVKRIERDIEEGKVPGQRGTIPPETIRAYVQHLTEEVWDPAFRRAAVRVACFDLPLKRVQKIFCLPEGQLNDWMDTVRI